MQRSKRSLWGYLVTIFLAAMAVAVILPGCGDDDTADSSGAIVPQWAEFVA